VELDVSFNHRNTCKGADFDFKGEGAVRLESTNNNFPSWLASEDDKVYYCFSNNINDITTYLVWYLVTANSRLFV
jgi:hypothetical protein